jgi:hypothetical protein
MDPNPYAAPKSTELAPARTSASSASAAESRASAFGIYLYFLCVEQVVVFALTLRSGPKASLPAWLFVLGLCLFFLYRLLVAARSLRALRPSYLIHVRYTLSFALGWLIIYAFRWMRSGPTPDALVSGLRLLILARIYTWAHARSLDGTLRQRAPDAPAFSPSWPIALALVGGHIVMYVAAIVLVRQ